MEIPEDLTIPKTVGFANTRYIYIGCSDLLGPALAMDTETDRKAVARWLREAAEFLEGCDE